MDDLCRTALDDIEGSSKDFVPSGQVAQTIVQNVDVEGTEKAATAHARQARSLSWVQAMIPECLLCKRQRHRCRARDTNDLRRRRDRRGSIAVDEFGKSRKRGVIGKGSKAQLDPKRRKNMGPHSC